MKLLIVRHGDPDYAIDSLTETGWIEAELLSDRLCKLDVKAFYCSPMGRAQDTAKATLGTLAGDDTAVVIMRDTNAAATFCGEIKSLING